MYHGTIGVVPLNDSVIGDQVRNGIDTAYLLQDAKACPSLVYLNSMGWMWSGGRGTGMPVHREPCMWRVASPGYSAIGSWRCGYI